MLVTSCAHMKLLVDYKLCCHSRPNFPISPHWGARCLSLEQHGALLSQLKSERKLSGKNTVEDIHCFLDIIKPTNRTFILLIPKRRIYDMRGRCLIKFHEIEFVCQACISLGTHVTKITENNLLLQIADSSIMLQTINSHYVLDTKKRGSIQVKW